MGGASVAKSNAQRCREYRARQGAAISLPMPPATKQALADLMAWHGFDDQREAIATMLHRMHDLGRERSAAMFAVVKHDFRPSDSMIQRLVSEGARSRGEE